MRPKTKRVAHYRQAQRTLAAIMSRLMFSRRILGWDVLSFSQLKWENRNGSPIKHKDIGCIHHSSPRHSNHPVAPAHKGALGCGPSRDDAKDGAQDSTSRKRCLSSSILPYKMALPATPSTSTDTLRKSSFEARPIDRETGND